MKPLAMPKSLSFLTNEGIDKNFTFLVIEVTKQVEGSKNVLDSPTQRSIERVSSRDDYIDNLKSVIGQKCFTFHIQRNPRKKEIDIVRAIDIMTNNLERIADHAVSIAEQVSYFQNKSYIKGFAYEEMFFHVFNGLKLIPSAIEKMDINVALEICKCEFKLDITFKKEFRNIIESLKTGKDTGDLITSLFIIRYIERMGDCLQNIGEAMISAVIGQKLKIADYEAIEDSLKSRGNSEMEDMTMEAFTETRSGCRIKRITTKKSKDKKDRGVIFKDGNTDKILKEKEMIEAWDAISPGLPPRIFSYKGHGESASILLEYLDGVTLQQLVVDARNGLIQETLKALEKTVVGVWGKTRRETPSNAAFISQLRKRMDDIYVVHPEFKTSSKQINSLTTSSYEEILDIAEGIERELFCPFSVFIHGDFNIDNILYNQENGRIHYIDLHRSGYQDYVQDVAVFLVSNFRLPIFVPTIRRAINQVVFEYYHFAGSYALQNNDKTFYARLALGLARSFITSTRFEFNRSFSVAMYQRSFYLLEKLRDHQGKPWEEFAFPLDVLSY